MSEEQNVITTSTESEDKIGNVKISVEVIATVAGIATTEINGVAGMSGSVVGGIAEILGKKNKGKGVKVELGEDFCNIDVYIIVDYGVSIPDIAWEVQENVKNSVESMTGMNVSKINIHVEGVNFDKEQVTEVDFNGEEEITEE
ncbi:MAG: Asp23/Gls24 family envelope stress response protein [Eubacteriales bacterium]|nr:Asp23/Gls24 family envelope stress response protein [Eubacteriales bacterium]